MLREHRSREVELQVTTTPAASSMVMQALQPSNSSSVSLPPITQPYATTQHIADVLLQWELEERVPQTVKQSQKKDIERIFEAKLDTLQQYIDTEIATQLEGVALQQPVSIQARECPGISTFFPDIFRTIETERSYAKKTLGVVSHEVLVLGESTFELRADIYSEGTQVVASKDECIIFPFAESIAQVLQQQDIFDAMETFRQRRAMALQREGDVLQQSISSYYDGLDWRTHPFFEAHRDAYSLAFYYDEDTVTNPLGQYKRKVRFATVVTKHH